MRVARLATLALLFSQVGQETISIFIQSLEIGPVAPMLGCLTVAGCQPDCQRALSRYFNSCGDKTSDDRNCLRVMSPKDK